MIDAAFGRPAGLPGRAGGVALLSGGCSRVKLLATLFASSLALDAGVAREDVERGDPRTEVGSTTAVRSEVLQDAASNSMVARAARTREGCATVRPPRRTAR